MNICVVGTGYVGLVSGACFAEMGNNVVCVDVNEEIIKGLNKGVCPIYEPGLDDIVKRNSAQKRLRFITSLGEGVKASKFIFIAVGTPTDQDGSADLKYVLEVADQIGKEINEYKVIIIKSTVPVGTAEKVKNSIMIQLKNRGEIKVDFDVVSCPEFLKEGTAVEDFLRPDRIIIGADNPKAAKLMQELYEPFVRNANPIYIMSVASSEMTKYAANAMLATRISFMNELALLCEKSGADIQDIRKGIGSDRRIGMSFLYAGIGYGGSCFPKDVKALIATGREYGEECELIKAVESVNKKQRKIMKQKIADFFENNLEGKKITVWGLSFKPHTDDVREAPAIDLIKYFIEQGAIVQAYDPVAIKQARKILGNSKQLLYYDDCYEALEGSNALLLATEWPQFRKPDWSKVKTNLSDWVIFDGRNQFDLQEMKELGIRYHCIGRMVYND